VNASNGKIEADPEKESLVWSDQTQKKGLGLSGALAKRKLI